MNYKDFLSNSPINNTANNWFEQYMNNTFGQIFLNQMNSPRNNNVIDINEPRRTDNQNNNRIDINNPIRMNNTNTQINQNINSYKPKTINNQQINKDIIDENQKLIEELLNEVDKYKTENDQLKAKITQLENDNNKLTNEINKSKKIITELNKNQKDEQENQYVILSLKEALKDKEKKISDLQTQLSNTTNIKKSENSFNFDDIIVVHFISMDQKINCPLKCLKTDTFAEVEEKLYQRYEEYRETNNNFLTNGKMVLRFKKIGENNIKDGDKINLISID